MRPLPRSAAAARPPPPWTFTLHEPRVSASWYALIAQLVEHGANTSLANAAVPGSRPGWSRFLFGCGPAGDAFSPKAAAAGAPGGPAERRRWRGCLTAQRATRPATTANDPPTHALNAVTPRAPLAGKPPESSRRGSGPPAARLSAQLAVGRAGGSTTSGTGGAGRGRAGRPRAVSRGRNNGGAAACKSKSKSKREIQRC